jgi:WD40 repeat protein
MGKKLRTEVEIEKICEYNGHKGSIFALALSDDEQWLFSSGDDGMVVKWSLDKGKDDGEGILRIAGSVYALIHLMPWNMLVAGSSSGSLYFIDLNSHKILHQYARTTDPIYQLAFHQKTQTLYVLHGGGFLSEVSIPDFSEKRFRRLSEGHLRSMVIAGEEGKIFIGNSDHQIMELEAESGKVLHHWQAHDNSVFGLMHVPESSLLFSGGRDAHMNVWDLKKSYQEVQSIPAHNYTLNDFALSPDGDYFATASRDKTLKIWDTHSFQLLKVIDFARNMAHTHSVNRIFWLKSDNSLISCSDDRRIIRWRIAFLSKEV